MSAKFPPQLIEVVRAAAQIAVLTGAGISAESGVPTFRQAQSGLWAQYDPQELATPQAFQRNPPLVWEWYAWRRTLVEQVQPNPGHFALAEMARRGPGLTLITQNIDGLHQKAGSPNVIELHGSIRRVKCFSEDQPVEQWAETGEIPPRCPRCGGLLRPDVVWFNENLPPQALQAAITAAKTCDLFFSIGTSGLVNPAASLPYYALERDKPVVEINPEPTPLTEYVSYSIQGPSGIVLPALVESAWPQVKAPG
ncbi:MAG TPA: NAD-dependent deacylase [Anaerolineales bacterium]|nr:NAD-dependent deacylase [Anaerolineales bacterium]